MMDTQAIAERIKTARTRRGWTQAQLAARCGMAQPRISEAENARGPLLVGTLDRIAEGLGVKTVYFFRT